MKPLTIVIVDDESLARQGLRHHLREIEGVEIIAEFGDSQRALNYLQTARPDLLLVDIEMPGMTGMVLVEKLADPLPAVAFVTAFDQYAIEAFRHQAIDYLLKPVESERLEEAIKIAREQRNQELASDEKKKLMEMVVSLTGKSPAAIDEMLESGEKLVEQPDRLAIKDGSSITFVPVHDIDWIDAAGDYMCVHVQGATHIMRTTMKELEAKLDPSMFQRVHRSTIVNLERVEKVSSHINGEFHLTLKCGTSLKMSRSYKDKVKHFF